ncbi:PepSY domain-containing protein [Enterovirga aerilata]|uniref:PepSY domain-containing protein n=1 Tax=Enterovirga aerilata TaxID=2730920 RepID=A0A849I5H8_9HYPH|nr:PepSY domain-containing protein [Enterovirga sp. DB1703]NNM72638.1 PepSY domain-containing protein [Enterovirga sp. DB1703]
MRRALIGTILAALGSPSARAADRAAEPPCLSPGDTVEVVAAHEVVAPSEALVHVRRAVPDSEILRASLCREPDALVYRIVLLTRDGRVVRVTVDAPSGKVKTVH